MPTLDCSNRYVGAVDVSTLASLIAALGVGGAIGQYVGAAGARREIRSEFLKAVAAVEEARFSRTANGEDFPEFVTAIRDLETAGLLARIPRRALQHYVVFARAARYLSGDAVDFDPVDQEFWGSPPTAFNTLVRDTAEVLSRLAWSPWKTQLTLGRELSKIRGRALELQGYPIQHYLGLSQRFFYVLPGPLAQLPDVNEPGD
ncbi:hypothetical protein [Mycobacterium sp. AZCC_0083]|uniref:hypothetical protein n=1 Tax=Mycobacterium sp. AZCC_0083 TaxID=2735882 RepID=UPI00160A6B0D|nr:hypothetical protein [Mycobacterium sp. AZCC_0083]MBB5161589.1 hypothetical protein [Mycobacterium sp. AZCC_0083]